MTAQEEKLTTSRDQPDSCNFLLLYILRAFGSKAGDPNYDVRADIYPETGLDGHVNIQDFNQWRRKCLGQTDMSAAGSTTIELGQGLSVTVNWKGQVNS